MIRLHFAARRHVAGPVPFLVLMLLALLALGSAGCAESAMKGAATPPSYARADVYRNAPSGGAAAAAEAPAEPEPTLTSTASFEDDEVESTGSVEKREVAQNAPAAPMPRPAPAKKVSDARPTPPPSPPAPKSVVTGSARPPETAALASPLLIYRANLTMAVFETKKSLDHAEQIARDAGGYLVRRDDRSITVRVPAGRFHGALASMMKLGDVLHRDVSVEDVTAQYRDLQIRLKNAEAVRDRLAALLKKAQSVKDALEVERELARVTDEIERMKGKLKLLHELVQYSTITLRFQPRSVEHVESTVNLPFPWLRNLGLGRLLSL